MTLAYCLRLKNYVVAHGLEVIASLSKPLSYKKLLKLFEQHDPSSRQKEVSGPRLSEDAITPKDLVQALESNQLALHFQPQIDMATGELFGVEALVRWYHPEQGLISPRLLNLSCRKQWSDERIDSLDNRQRGQAGACVAGRRLVTCRYLSIFLQVILQVCYYPNRLPVC